MITPLSEAIYDEEVNEDLTYQSSLISEVKKVQNSRTQSSSRDLKRLDEEKISATAISDSEIVLNE